MDSITCLHDIQIYFDQQFCLLYAKYYLIWSAFWYYVLVFPLQRIDFVTPSAVYCCKTLCIVLASFSLYMTFLYSSCMNFFSFSVSIKIETEVLQSIHWQIFSFSFFSLKRVEISIKLTIK